MADRDSICLQYRAHGLTRAQKALLTLLGECYVALYADSG